MQGILAVADTTTQLRRIELFVICDNQRAVDLYRQFGFEIEGRHDCFARRKHHFVDVYSMSRIAKSGGDS